MMANCTKCTEDHVNQLTKSKGGTLQTDQSINSLRANGNSDKSLEDQEWKCPNITNTRNLECGCDIPHTLRCSGDVHGLEALAESLRVSPYKVSLLDCTLRNVTILSNARIFENISLHGLVISSGEIKRIHKLAFAGLNSRLEALGLPSNSFVSVPRSSISYLTSLERLDLSNNRIKALESLEFTNLRNLSFLELSDNEISSISLKTFEPLQQLITLKLGGNHLGEQSASIYAIGKCRKLRDLDLHSNLITGSLTFDSLPKLLDLESLNLERNLIKSVENKSLQGFSKLKSLCLRYNQIDVLEDHAFYGLGRLEVLDLSYNGIVAVSSSSLLHLISLKILDLTHNFLRALTSDLVLPLPSLQQLLLGGNDISIIAKNALEEAKHLHSLCLNENPLTCDCSTLYFLEWLQASKLDSKDLMSPTCATPPHLEGAPLFQVPVESFVCDTDTFESDNNKDVRQLNELSVPQNLTSVRDLSEMIFLTDFHFSTDYGLILTWTVNLKDDYTCDAIFVYKEENVHEILIDDSMIHCESKVISGRNTVSVIVPSSSSLLLGESYRFCLVLVQQKRHKSELEVGCSNVIKLQADDELNQLNDKHVMDRVLHVPSSIPSIDESTSRSTKLIRRISNVPISKNIQESFDADSPYRFYRALTKSFLPGLGIGVLIAVGLVLLWAVTKLRKKNSRCGPAAATCYTESRTGTVIDPERGNRYLKLQATTSL